MIEKKEQELNSKIIGEGQVEFKLRNGGEVETLSIEEVYNRVREEFERANLSL